MVSVPVPAALGADGVTCVPASGAAFAAPPRCRHDDRPDGPLRRSPEEEHLSRIPATRLDHLVAVLNDVDPGRVMDAAHILARARKEHLRDTQLYFMLALRYQERESPLLASVLHFYVLLDTWLDWMTAVRTAFQAERRRRRARRQKDSLAASSASPSPPEDCLDDAERSGGHSTRRTTSMMTSRNVSGRMKHGRGKRWLCDGLRCRDVSVYARWFSRSGSDEDDDEAERAKETRDTTTAEERQTRSFVSSTSPPSSMESLSSCTHHTPYGGMVVVNRDTSASYVDSSRTRATHELASALPPGLCGGNTWAHESAPCNDAPPPARDMKPATDTSCSAKARVSHTLPSAWTPAEKSRPAKTTHGMHANHRITAATGADTSCIVHPSLSSCDASHNACRAHHAPPLSAAWASNTTSPRFTGQETKKSARNREVLKAGTLVSHVNANLAQDRHGCDASVSAAVMRDGRREDAAAVAAADAHEHTLHRMLQREDDWDTGATLDFVRHGHLLYALVSEALCYAGVCQEDSVAEAMREHNSMTDDSVATKASLEHITYCVEEQQQRRQQQKEERGQDDLSMSSRGAHAERHVNSGNAGTTYTDNDAAECGGSAADFWPLFPLSRLMRSATKLTCTSSQSGRPSPVTCGETPMNGTTSYGRPPVLVDDQNCANTNTDNSPCPTKHQKPVPTRMDAPVDAWRHTTTVSPGRASCVRQLNALCVRHLGWPADGACASYTRMACTVAVSSASNGYPLTRECSKRDTCADCTDSVGYTDSADPSAACADEPDTFTEESLASTSALTLVRRLHWLALALWRRVGNDTLVPPPPCVSFLDGAVTPAERCRTAVERDEIAMQIAMERSCLPFHSHLHVTLPKDSVMEIAYAPGHNEDEDEGAVTTKTTAARTMQWDCTLCYGEVYVYDRTGQLLRPMWDALRRFMMDWEGISWYFDMSRANRSHEELLLHGRSSSPSSSSSAEPMSAAAEDEDKQRRRVGDSRWLHGRPYLQQEERISRMAKDASMTSRAKQVVCDETHTHRRHTGRPVAASTPYYPHTRHTLHTLHTHTRRAHAPRHRSPSHGALPIASSNDSVAGSTTTFELIVHRRGGAETTCADELVPLSSVRSVITTPATTSTTNNNTVHVRDGPGDGDGTKKGASGAACARLPSRASYAVSMGAWRGGQLSRGGCEAITATTTAMTTACERTGCKHPSRAQQSVVHTTRTKCDETCNGQLASSTATTRVRHTSIEDGTGRSCVSASASRCAANTCALDSLHDDAVHALGVRHKGTAKKDNEGEEEEEEDEEETAEAAASSSSPDGIINFSATIVHESQQEGIALRDHRFRVSGQPVGVGAFGAVYRALDLETGIIVAVKQSRYSVDHNRVSLSWREFKTWSMLPSHTNVITFHGASHEAETQQLLLVLEYASGGSISSLYREYGPIPEHIFRRHAREMAQGLQHLHNHNVVHGDVKPENVLTRSDGSVAISDFGCSRLPFCPVAASRPADRSHMEGGGGGGRRGSRSATALGAGANAAGASCGLCDRADATHAGDEVGEDDEYATRQICGTVAYMAPEVINSASVLKSDVWAYACSLLQLYLDTLPWTTTANIQDTHEPLALMYFIATHEAAIPYSEEQIYSAPRWLQKIANRAFKRDLASRCTMGEVLSILTEYND